MPNEKQWYTVDILNLKTGERGQHRDQWDRETQPEQHDLEFLWTEHNYGCDCNRALLLGRCHGREDWDAECGEGGYVIRLTLDDGTVVVEDGGWTAQSAAVPT